MLIEFENLVVYFNTNIFFCRKTEFRNYYLKCHRGCVSSKWQEIVSGSIDGPQPSDNSDLSLLSEFYELLLSTWHTEIKWCSSIFGKDSSPAIVAQLLLEVTLSVESGPGVLISNTIQGYALEKLQTLTDLHKITRNFTLNLKQAVTDGGYLESIEPAMLAKLADAFWHSYIPFLLQYKELEQQTLLTFLSDISLDAHDIIDVVQLVEGSVKKLFDHARTALARCEELTGKINQFFSFALMR